VWWWVGVPFVCKHNHHIQNTTRVNEHMGASHDCNLRPPPVNDCDMVIVLARLGNNDYATHSSEQIAVRTQLTCYGWMAYGTSNCYLRVPQ
jgi:hypothetical protein